MYNVSILTKYKDFTYNRFIGTIMFESKSVKNEIDSMFMINEVIMQEIDIKSQLSNDGNVYLIRMDDSRLYKIGYSKNIIKRIANIRTNIPKKIILVTSCPGTKLDERYFHRKYASFNYKGEWFELPIDKIESLKKEFFEIREEFLKDPEGFHQLNRYNKNNNISESTDEKDTNSKSKQYDPIYEYKFNPDILDRRVREKLKTYFCNGKYTGNNYTQYVKDGLILIDKYRDQFPFVTDYSIYYLLISKKQWPVYVKNHKDLIEKIVQMGINWDNIFVLIYTFSLGGDPECTNVKNKDSDHLHLILERFNLHCKNFKIRNINGKLMR